MKRILACLLAVMLALPAAALAKDGEMGTLEVFGCDDWVSLRAEPDSDSKRLTKVPVGELLTDCAWHSNEFIYGYYDGWYGYVLAEYLKVPGTYAVPAVGMAEVYNCLDGVWMYSEPDSDSRELVRVPKGELVYDCEDSENGYCYGYYGGWYGYIEGKYLKLPGEDAGGHENYLGDMIVYNCDSYVSLREEPSTKSRRLAKVPRGASVLDCYEAGNGFIYGCYDGQYGYIAEDYLTYRGGKATGGIGDAETRRRMIMVEGMEETIIEAKYDSRLGFSLWYSPEWFKIVDDAFESGETSFLVESVYAEEFDTVCFLEFLPATVTGLDGDGFLAQMPGRYGAKDVSEIHEERTETGCTLRWRGGWLDDKGIEFYVISKDGREAQAVAVVGEELLEGYGRRLDEMVRTVEFP